MKLLNYLTRCYPEHFPAPSPGWTAVCDRRREVFGSGTAAPGLTPLPGKLAASPPCALSNLRSPSTGSERSDGWRHGAHTPLTHLWFQPMGTPGAESGTTPPQFLAGGNHFLVARDVTGRSGLRAMSPELDNKVSRCQWTHHCRIGRSSPQTCATESL